MALLSPRMALSSCWNQTLAPDWLLRHRHCRRHAHSASARIACAKFQTPKNKINQTNSQLQSSNFHFNDEKLTLKQASCVACVCQRLRADRPLDAGTQVQINVTLATEASSGWHIIF